MTLVPLREHQELPQSIRVGSLNVPVKLSGGALGSMPSWRSSRVVTTCEARSWVEQRRAMRRSRPVTTYSTDRYRAVYLRRCSLLRRRRTSASTPLDMVPG
jgi:hypothetical protein